MGQTHFGWGPKWHRNMTHTMMELGYLSDPPAPNLLVIQEHTGCSSGGVLDS